MPAREREGGPGAASTTEIADASRTRWGRDALGVAWTVAAAVVVLLPALRPGVSLGPFDLLSRFGLTRQPGVAVHNAVQADQIFYFLPMVNAAWHQVHSGHLPLWNPYNITGLPLAFNWQSGVFSLPALIGYLVPVSHAYAVMVLAKLVIAGTGVYVLCRLLKLGPLAAAFGGTAFELSGPMIVHGGWAMTGVTCWAGWLLAAVVGLLRGTHRFRYVLMLALVLGWAVYGGHPESLVVLGVFVAVFVIVLLVAHARTSGGPVLRPVRDVVIGVVCGCGLGAPLLFPGVQLGLISARRAGTGTPAFSLSHVTNVLAVGLQGTDFRTAAYVGVVVLALAVVGVRASWHQPAVPALVAVAIVSALLTFFSPADKILNLVPGGHTVTWSRAVMLLALALAVLGAIGLEALARPTRQRTSVQWAAGAFGVLGLVTLAMGAAAVLGLAPAIDRHRASLVWPLVQAVVGLGLAGTWLRAPRSGAHSTSRDAVSSRWGPALLVALETAFLLNAGIPFWSVSSTYFPTNPAITELQHTVGTSLVGYGGCRSFRYLTPSKAEVGIRPDANIGYQLHEFAVYDPILPARYFRAWKAISGERTPPALEQIGIFCAQITTVAEARVFGVGYVLEPVGRFGPAGSVLVGGFGGEALVSVPGSAEATAIAVPARGATLPTEAPGTPVPVTHPDPASWRVLVDSPTAAVVRLRLTNVPGWQATVDGKPVALHPWASGSMLEVQVTPGHHVVEVHYWPSAFSAGIDVGAAVATGLVVTGIGTFVVGRRRRARPAL